ncbi:MAG TPA: hypothetical protein VMH86_08020 [Rhizomicrobium sp.]|nr:hypothetical protein [Rhizomicrobium sp.]
MALIVVAMLAAFPARAEKLTVWHPAHGSHAQTYHLGGYTLTLSAKPSKDGMPVPAIEVEAPAVAPGLLLGEPGFDSPSASFGVGRFDPKNAFPQVLIATYTGGAHCCDAVKLLERDGKGWKTVDLGQWDGDAMEDLPRDVDGDGVADFVFGDNDFLYTFESYAGSWAPPQILNVIGGNVVDVSKARRYAPLFRADMARAKVYCAQGSNGACAGYVADAARLGEIDPAWKFMQAHYNRKHQWDLPARCQGPTVDFQCKGRAIKPRDYPEALAWFLHDHGYTR